jgi:tryptophan halogenase
MKKIAVIGRGTAGALSIAQVMADMQGAAEFEWYYDSTISPQAVGEGSPQNFPDYLFNIIGFSYSDMPKIDGHFKHGIRKFNWSPADDFTHVFPAKGLGYHFNAVKLQNLIFESLKEKVKIIDGKTTADQIDADYIIDCSGTNKDPELFHEAKYIPVNAAYVTQCPWDAPRFSHTLTIARPYGWVFGIPLTNRCSIGYMFNDTINSTEEVKEDVKNVFDQFNLTPSTTTNELHFKNYYRKKNFTSRVAYNGNASFFLEPLEATSISMMVAVNLWAQQVVKNKLFFNNSNNMYIDRLTKTERMIMLHYFAGSRFNSDFWDFAEERGRRCIESAMQDENWRKKYEVSKLVDFRNAAPARNMLNDSGYIHGGGEDWTEWSYYQNLSAMGMNLYDKIDALKTND